MKRYAGIALILAGGMILSAYTVSKLYLRIRKEEAISVKGVAERLVTSDLGKLKFDVVDTDQILSNALLRVRTNYRTITGRISEQYAGRLGLFPEEPVIRRIMETTDDGRETDRLAYYYVSCGCGMVTTNVQLVAEIASILTDYASGNILVQASRPEYLISDLGAVKLNLLQEATQDGWIRAQALSQKNGQVGHLVSASQGVFQITTPYSTDSSWYGEYDTSTIEKRIRAVVTLGYEIK